jgi:hypothetical protein
VVDPTGADGVAENDMDADKDEAEGGDDDRNTRDLEDEETRVGAAPEPAAPRSDAYGTEEMVTLSGSAMERSISGRPLGRRYVTLGLALGARLDEPTPGTVISFGFAQRVSPRAAAGLRLDLGIAPAADEPVVGNLLVDLTRHALRRLELQLGAGLAWSGELGFGYRLGLGTGVGPLSVGLRLSGAITPDTAPATLGLGVDASF